MAQMELLSMTGAAMPGSFTAEELHEIRECEKLIRFRDEVLSGVHPRIKPAHLTAKTVPTDALTSSAASPPAIHPTTSKKQAGATGQATHTNTPSAQASLQGFSVNTSQAVPGLGSLPNGGKATAASARPFVPSGSTEINPVLLEKSVDLVKAEMSLKRQRLERSLRDEVDQRRTLAKAASQPSESIPDFDLGEVLSKAQALVKPISAPSTDDTAANASAAPSSDSFDDNTFYSSQHDTPEFLEEEPRAPNKSPEDVDMREESPYEPQFDAEPTVPVAPPQIVEPSVPKQTQSLAVAHSIFPTANIPTGPRAERKNGLEPRQNQPPKIPGLQAVPSFEGNGSQHAAAQPNHYTQQGNTAGQKSVAQPQLSSVNNAPLGERPDRQLSPVIRAHNLSPIAPQPAHVSPLAVARQPPQSAQFDEVIRAGTPAQVAALRMQPSAVSSPDSSPRGSGATEKKQKKKKKRKSERLAAEAISPRIKAEPRSPSPIVAPSFARPNKRPRQEQRQPGGQGYDDARYDQPPRADDGYAPRYEQRRTYVEERYPPSQHAQYVEDLGPRQPRQPPSTVISNDIRYEREYYEPVRPSPVVYRPASPGSAFPGEYIPGQVRQVRAVSHAVVERPYREAPVLAPYSGGREGRMSVRPAADRERSRSPVAYERHASIMPPPRVPVRRIIVDEYGREYIEPPRPAAVRASVAPGAALDEPEVIYERTVPARRPDVYEDGPVYGQPSPYAPANPPYARRVVTQPELAGPDYRAYRERDYAPRPVVRYRDEMPPPGAERLAEVPREYVARAVSVRPAGDAYQYEGPVGYQRRVVEEVPWAHAPVRAGSVRPPEGQRYEVRHGYERSGGEYGAAPVARTASVRPGEPLQYGEVVRDPGWRGGSVRPEVREYAPSAQPATHHEMLPPAPPQRAYSVRPSEVPTPEAVRQEYQQRGLRPAAGYYGQAPARGDEGVTYVDQLPRQDAYGAPARH